MRAHERTHRLDSIIPTPTSGEVENTAQEALVSTLVGWREREKWRLDDHSAEGRHAGEEVPEVEDQGFRLVMVETLGQIGGVCVS